MTGIKDEHRLESVRDRLYARNAEQVRAPRHTLTDKELQERRKQVPHEWSTDTAQKKTTPEVVGPRVDARSAMKRAGANDVRPVQEQKPQAPMPDNEITSVDPSVSSDVAASSHVKAANPTASRRRYRVFAILSAMLLLVAGAVYTFFFGFGEISSRNISVDITAPSTIGAGEEVPIDITLRNDNLVPVVSGTLVVQFPDGSREVDDPTRSLRTTRIPLERIESGGTQEIPIRAIIFGEEGEEKEVRARLDYRVEGTNSVLERTLDPIAMQVTSAPLSLQIDTTEQVAAGQEVDITVRVNSNAPNVLSDVLVTASYPSGFEFVESDPSPVFGDNVWRIDQIEAAGSESVTIRGVFRGGDRDEFAMDFSAGLPREDNRFAIGSLYATDRTDFLIEQPFFAIDFALDGKRGESVAIDSRRSTAAFVQITNTLDSAIYDTRLAIKLSGNALNPDEVRVRDGFYDSASNVVRFDVTTDRNLERIAPGAQRAYNFELSPDQVGTGQIDFEVDVYGRRTSDASAQEQLVGQIFSSAQYTSVINLSRTLLYDDGPFTNTGPVPPVAEERTTYTVDLVAAAGQNDLLDGQVNFTLPTYVEWLDTYEGPGTIEYNPTNQEVVWSIGSISAEEVARLQFQLAFNPSRSQVRNSPVLVNTQSFRATDRFTGEVVRDESNLVSTELPRSSDFPRDNGIVQPIQQSMNEPDVADDEEN